MKKVFGFITTVGTGHAEPGEHYMAKWLEPNVISTTNAFRDFKHSNQIYKHNHVR